MRHYGGTPHDRPFPLDGARDARRGSRTTPLAIAVLVSGSALVLSLARAQHSSTSRLASAGKASSAARVSAERLSDEAAPICSR